MAHLNVTTIGGDGEPHPFAREVHRQIRDAIDRSERSLRWIAEGEQENKFAEVINAEGRLIREIGQQIVAVAYELDDLVALVRAMRIDGSA
jgi:mevalonate kinase